MSETKYCKHLNGTIEGTTTAGDNESVEDIDILPICCFDVDKFVEEYRKIHSFWSNKKQIYEQLSLNETSNMNLKRLSNDLNKYYAQKNVCNIPHIAYMLATVKVESYNFLRGIFFAPITEIISDTDANLNYDAILGKDAHAREKGQSIGNSVRGDGARYKGRGFVQITGKSAYRKFTNKLNVDFVTNPNLVLVWENAFKIMILGMTEGTFTGVKLSDYINNTQKDYYNARSIINGHFEANHISHYAQEFEKCLLDSKK